MTTPSTAIGPSTPDKPTGNNKPGSAGIEGLFEQISQQVLKDEVAAGSAEKPHCVSQCAADAATAAQPTRPEAGPELPGELAQPSEGAKVEASNQPGDTKQANGNEPGLLTHMGLPEQAVAKGIRQELARGISEGVAQSKQLGSPTNTAAIDSLASDSIQTPQSVPDLAAKNTQADPLARALQALQSIENPASNVNKAADKTNTPVVLPNQAAQPAGAQEQTLETLGINQARQQLEANLVRWANQSAQEAPAPSPNSLASSAANASSQLLASQPAQTSAVSNSSLPQFSLPGNINQPAWQQALANRVVMLNHQNIHQAELKLHPAELGTVSVRLETLQDGPQTQTNLQMTALHADARDALEAALPRLRELLNQQGINLGQADIQQGFSQTAEQTADQNGGQSDSADNKADGNDATTAAVASAESSSARKPADDALLDLYA